MKTRPLAVLGIAILAACDVPADGGTGAAPIIIEAADLNVVGTSDAIAAVLDLQVLEDGSVWLLNSIDPLFIGFPAGAAEPLLRGRSGGGPEEFGRPAGFVTGAPDGDAWLLDSQRHLLVEIGQSEAPRRELPLPAEAIPPGTIAPGMNLLSSVVRTAKLGDEIVVPRRFEVPGEDVFAYWLGSWSADLVAWSPATGEARVVVSLSEVLGDPRPHLQLGEGLPPFPLWFRLWTACSGELRVYDRLRNQIRSFAADGSELQPLTLPPVHPRSVTPRDFARIAFDMIAVERMGAVPADPTFEMAPADSARLIDQALQRVTASPEQLAAVLPRYVDLRCSPDGTLWLRPIDVARGGLGGGPLWLRFGPEGEMREVRLPERFDPYRFTNERIWGIQRDELDVATVAWLPMPAGG